MVKNASITYLLSEEGQRDSLRKGGDGRRVQTVAQIIANPADLNLFDVDAEGNVSVDLTRTPIEFETDPKRHHRQVTDRNGTHLEVLWAVVPEWTDLMAFARWLRQTQERLDLEQHLEWENDQAAKEQIEYEFLANPRARADKLAEDFVVISGSDFWENDAPVVVEARARAARDAEELRNANRATLAKWIKEHGTDNQRQRLAAGLLPWAEAHEAVEEHLYAALSECPPYRRFEISEVCVCPPINLDHGEERDLCRVKFKSFDATELSATEWEQFSKIKDRAPDATFQLREHEAACVSEMFPSIRRGVIVKFTLGQLTFKREFAL